MYRYILVCSTYIYRPAYPHIIVCGAFVRGDGRYMYVEYCLKKRGVVRKRVCVHFRCYQSIGMATTRTATTPSMMPARTASNSEQLNRSPTNCALSAFPETYVELRLQLCVSGCVSVCLRLCALCCFYRFRAVGVVVVVVSATMRHQ